MNDISIIIPTFNTCDLTCACVSSVLRARSSLSVEILVVDNASDDGTADAVLALCPDVKVLKQSVNLGYSKAVNIGLKTATGKLVIALNSDTVLQPDALTTITDALANMRNIGVACPRTINPDGTIQSYGSDLLLFRHYFLQLFGISPYSFNRDPEISCYVGAPSGACLVFTQAGLAAIPQLDENLPLYFEEQDIARRITQMNLLCYYISTSVIVHRAAQTTRMFRKADLVRKLERSRAHIFAKYFSGLPKYVLCTSATLSTFMKSVLFLMISICFLPMKNRRKDTFKVSVAYLTAMRFYWSTHS